jgi:hypothetical protein
VPTDKSTKHLLHQQEISQISHQVCDAFILVFSPVSLWNFVFRFKCLSDQTFSPFLKKRKNPILLLRIYILLLVAAPMAMDSVCWRQPDGRDSLYIASRTNHLHKTDLPSLSTVPFFFNGSILRET